MKLLVDENLAKLGRYCRFMGIDTIIPFGWSDDLISECALVEGRLLVSRDREFCRLHEGESLHIVSDDFGVQLSQVKRAVGAVPEEQWFTRCVECNERLRELGPEEKADRLPADWLDRPGWECEACGRAYWRGSHYERTRERLREIS